MSMNINLTPQLEELVRSKVASGFYNSASEVIHEALLLMEQDDRMRVAAVARLQHDILEGNNSASVGHLDINDIKHRARDINPTYVYQKDVHKYA